MRIGAWLASGGVSLPQRSWAPDFFRLLCLGRLESIPQTLNPERLRIWDLGFVRSRDLGLEVHGFGFEVYGFRLVGCQSRWTACWHKRRCCLAGFWSGFLGRGSGSVHRVTGILGGAVLDWVSFAGCWSVIQDVSVCVCWAAGAQQVSRVSCKF